MLYSSLYTATQVFRQMARKKFTAVVGAAAAAITAKPNR